MKVSYGGPNTVQAQIGFASNLGQFRVHRHTSMFKSCYRAEILPSDVKCYQINLPSTSLNIIDIYLGTFFFTFTLSGDYTRSLLTCSVRFWGLLSLFRLLRAGRGRGTSPGEWVPGTPALLHRPHKERPSTEVQTQRETHQAALVSNPQHWTSCTKKCVLLTFYWNKAEY